MVNRPIVSNRGDFGGGLKQTSVRTEERTLDKKNFIDFTGEI